MSEQIDLLLGDIVELNSGGPPMTIIELTTPGKSGERDSVDAVAWWRADGDSPQIIEIDSRCVRVIARGGSWQPVGTRMRWRR